MCSYRQLVAQTPHLTFSVQRVSLGTVPIIVQRSTQLDAACATPVLLYIQLDSAAQMSYTPTRLVEAYSTRIRSI